MLYLFVFLLSVGCVVFFRMKTADTAKPKISPDDLELFSVRDAVMEKHGWSAERADAARTEYVRFLTLLQGRPGFMLVPWLDAEGRDDLDQFWHQHILDTAKYELDCKRLFGRMIHHNPHVVRGSGQETDAVEKTQRLYARTFDSGTFGSPVDSVMLTGCGTCASGDGHHAGDAGHGDGGHSCGGHSCGGHSCGSACGGH